MERFTRLVGPAAPMAEANVDTDIIFPARFLLITEKKGLGRYAFHDRRRRADGADDPDFVLNQAPYAGARILVAGDNFGCGSSREQAVWALHDLGLRCLISTSFGEIFQANCFKNGMLALTILPADLADLMSDAEGGLPLEIDLERQTISRRNGLPIGFSIPDWRREALLNGWDEIDIVIRQDGDHISAFERTQRTKQPWLYQGE